MRTKSLFHFTKERDVLFSILKDGFWPRYCFEDIRWVSGTDFYGGPMVCFCDIALSKLKNHTEFYGNYGIGMTKEWGEKNGLNPLLYISEGSVVSDTLHGMMSHPDPDHDDAKANTMITLLHTKPLRGRMRMGDTLVEKEFYEECEWRFVDITEGGIFPDEITEETPLESFNSKTKANSLKFAVEDIRYILVEKVEDIGPTIDFIYAELGHFPQRDHKVLSTKIVVLEELQGDL